MADERLEKEVPPGFLRHGVLERIKNGLPITIDATSHGDTMISWWTHTQVLMQLCQEEGIDITAENLPLEIEPLGLDRTHPEAYYLFPMALSNFPYTANLQARYEVSSELEVLSYALGVTTLNSALLNEPPLPLPTNIGPLKNFDRQYVSLRASQLAKELQPFRRTVTVFQGGSSAFKRFTDDQIAEIVRHARKTWEGCYIKVITDKKLTCKESHATDYEADSVINSTDINEIGAHFSLPNTFLIGTDSFWSWFSVGCQKLMGYTPAGVFLYTLADSDRYGLPGIHRVESAALLWTRKNWRFGPNGMIKTDDYQRYFAFGDMESRGWPGDIVASQGMQIAAKDMAALKDEIDRLAA